MSTEGSPQPSATSSQEVVDDLPEAAAPETVQGHPAAQPLDPAERHASADATDAPSDAGSDPVNAASAQQDGQHARDDDDAAQAERDTQTLPQERPPVPSSDETPDAAHPLYDGPEEPALQPASDSEPDPSEIRNPKSEIEDLSLQPAFDAARPEVLRRTPERADAPVRSDLPRTAASLARLRAAMEPALGSLGLANGWHELEMQLENGDGSMTVRTHRDEDRVSVAVAFSDPSMRALASAQTTRLEEALRANYDSPVDFSLLGGGSEQAGSQQTPDEMPGRSRHGSSTRHAGEIGAADGSFLPHRPRLAGTHHEWIG